MSRPTNTAPTLDERLARSAADGVREPQVPTDPTEAIERAMQMLFSCSLMLCRASRNEESKEDLIYSAIEGLDESIRVLRGTASALD